MELTHLNWVAEDKSSWLKYIFFCYYRYWYYCNMFYFPKWSLLIHLTCYCDLYEYDFCFDALNDCLLLDNQILLLLFCEVLYDFGQRTLSVRKHLIPVYSNTLLCSGLHSNTTTIPRLCQWKVSGSFSKFKKLPLLFDSIHFFYEPDFLYGNVLGKCVRFPTTLIQIEPYSCSTKWRMVYFL